MNKICNKYALFWIQPNKDGIWHIGTAGHGIEIDVLCGKKFRRYSFSCLSYLMDKEAYTSTKKCKNCLKVVEGLDEPNK